MFPLPALVSLALSMFLAEHVIGQLIHLLLVSPCWMEATWLATVLKMLEDIPHWCPIVKISLWLFWYTCYFMVYNFCMQPFGCSEMCALQTMILFISVRQWRDDASVYNKSLPTVLEKWAGWCTWQGVPNNTISAPTLAGFLVHLFKVGLAWHTIGI